MESNNGTIQSYEVMIQKLLMGDDKIGLDLIYQDSYPTNVHVPVFSDDKISKNVFVFSQSILDSRIEKSAKLEEKLLRYIQASLRSQYNIQIDGVFEKITNGGLTRNLYFTSAKDAKCNIKTSTLQTWDGPIISLESIMYNNQYLKTKKSKAQFVTRTFFDLCMSVQELHDANISHNSILPKNILILAKSIEGMYDGEVLLQIPSFGIETIKETLNDEHVTYYSREAYESDNDFEPSNDVHMLGTMILSILCNEEIDAKMLDPQNWKNELQFVKDKAQRALTDLSSIDITIEVTIQKLLNLALQCISVEPEKRPNIEEIISVLDKCRERLGLIESDEEDLMPRQAQKKTKTTRAFSIGKRETSTSSSTTSSSSSTSTSEKKSRSWKALIKPFTALFTKKNSKDLEEGLKKKDSYQVTTRLSDGASAIVFLATKKETNEICVLKKYKDGAQRDFDREVECLKLFKHKNIIQMLDYFSYEEVDDSNKKSLCNVLVMEYCKYGDLFTQQISFVGTKGKKVKYMKPLKYLKLVVDLLNAMHLVHSTGYVHSDVKPQNILISQDGIRLADFGFSVKVNDPVIGGTMRYLPPEHNEGQPASNTIDVYSICYSLFEVLSKKKINLQAKITSKEEFEKLWEENLKENHHFSRIAKHGKKKCNHHFVEPLIDLLSRGLDPIPSKRLASQDALTIAVNTCKNHAAVVIQKEVRGFLVRRRLNKKKQ
ncbi:predicted protein [Naegleria gruberi]|uniref:Predicted protein n=1 Tax=Naegleria gruberi TaxID=5762 RepID=D2V1X0_NAEGR|nr:uncharacterized protein NAEGRDRAFT_45977 [Naegleria gruberi]EFC49383.1 predicted protein [Naegleria gruberi]|eukprot:XP_002682127.1 predicted protein [Naegleria gruberi strain NEG-M]